MRVRRAEREDAAALALLASATFLDNFAGILPGSDIVAHCLARNRQEDFAGWLSDPESAVGIAETGEGAAPIGYSVVAPPDLPVPTGAGDAELKRIYVLSRFHRFGTGSRLIASAMAQARAMGRERMLLGVYAPNTRARAFYEHHGFVLAGTRRFRVGASWFDDVVYARAL